MPAENWAVYIERRADREVGELPEHVRQEAVDAIEGLAEDPFPAGCEPLRRYNNAYRIHVGGDAYRIIYSVNRSRRMVRIWRVRSRGAAYQGMKNP